MVCPPGPPLTAKSPVVGALEPLPLNSVELLLMFALLPAINGPLLENETLLPDVRITLLPETPLPAARIMLLPEEVEANDDETIAGAAVIEEPDDDKEDEVMTVAMAEMLLVVDEGIEETAFVEVVEVIKASVEVEVIASKDVEAVDVAVVKVVVEEETDVAVKVNVAGMME